MGGLARKATIIDNIRAQGFDASIVDAGNLFFAKDNLLPGITTDVAKINSKTILKAFNEIGCDAFSPGSQDFALGLAHLQQLENEASFPFISANITDLRGDRIFNPYVIQNKEGVNIGYIGLASQFPNNEIKISDVMGSLTLAVNEVRPNCELLILLFNGTDQDVLKIQNSDLPIELIIRSKQKRGSRDGGDKRIPVYSAGDRGKKLYELNISLMSSGESLVDIGILENKLEKAQGRLDRMKTEDSKTIQDLYEKYANDINITNRLKGYEKQINDSSQGIKSATNTVSLVVHELNKKIADKPTILQIVDSGKEEVIKIQGPNFKPAVPYHDHNHKGHKH